MPKNGSHFHPAMQAASTSTPIPEVTDKVLAYEYAPPSLILTTSSETQNETKLQIYAPGWKQPPGVYAHDYWEEIYVVSGRLYDHTLSRWVEVGEYACRPPGQTHGPFECSPDEGCTVLLINTASWK